MVPREGYTGADHDQYRDSRCENPQQEAAFSSRLNAAQFGEYRCCGRHRNGMSVSVLARGYPLADPGKTSLPKEGDSAHSGSHWDVRDDRP